ncbi:VWA domain-containing protein [Hymenobacter sp. HMF4947]|uniref:VWA domain-containing protein n=1 Tax=Hymenobacter ginkgonis TaxID=2682976 RepID=A0A7K1TAU9_9BACT|nr:VWA domain-containing protein [Hymenobacter ginkgonis]MVN75518.1 VWA domain-containing protein [Hymenobacter ginkgonis]
MNLFSYATLAGYEWQHPRLLLLLALVPLLPLLRWLLARRRRQVLVAFGPGGLRPDWRALLRFLPDIVLSLSLALLIVAVARPQRADEHLTQTGQGIDIMLALDVSGSMEIEDLKPTRLAAAKRLARSFVQSRVGDRLGLIAFAGQAYSLVPLTTDYDLLLDNLSSLRPGLIADDGTAIGTAIGVAINRLRESKAKSRVCLLLSDGENTAGSLDPLLAAQLAHAYGIRLYTIGLGQDGFVPYGRDSLSGKPRYVQTRLDETTMRQLAQATAGRFFRATDNAALSNVFTAIDRLEKSDIQTQRYRSVQDYYRPYLSFGLLLWLLWLSLKATFLNNVLED